MMEEEGWGVVDGRGGWSGIKHEIERIDMFNTTLLLGIML